MKRLYNWFLGVLGSWLLQGMSGSGDRGRH